MYEPRELDLEKLRKYREFGSPKLKRTLARRSVKVEPKVECLELLN